MSSWPEKIHNPEELREIADRLDVAVGAARRRTSLNPEQARRYLLSEREGEILALLADGHTYGQCARLLSLAHSTIKTHASNVYAKLRASGAAHAVAIGFRLGILE